MCMICMRLYVLRELDAVQHQGVEKKGLSLGLESLSGRGLERLYNRNTYDASSKMQLCTNPQMGWLLLYRFDDMLRC